MTKQIIRSSSSAIKLLDEETKELKIKAAYDSHGRLIISDSMYYTDEQMRRDFKSFLGVPLKVGEKTIGVFELASLDPDAFGEEEKRMLQTLASQAAIAIENARLFEKTQRTYYETIKSLAQALEARDAYTKGHSERVTKYAIKVAEKMGLSEEDKTLISYSGLLHDIGKIGISDTILKKPYGLTLEEKTAIETHPLFGDNILSPIKFLEKAQQIVLHHHERYDGKGYPAGLRGEQIPITARIIAVTDAYDAMTSERPYRRALSHDDAIKELKEKAGTQFDPKVVETFLTLI
jgi:putative nucleotidyltransferase with HDIG domain